MFQFVDLQHQETFLDPTQYPPCSKDVHPLKASSEPAICPEQPKTLHQLTTYHELAAGESTVSRGLIDNGSFAAKDRSKVSSSKCVEKGRAKGEVDTSSFSIEERLVAAVWVHERSRMRISIGQIKRDFKQRFDKEPPTKNTLLIWEKKLFATGNMMDAKRSGRPCQRKEHIAAVQASVSQSPGLSLRARAAALALPRTTLRTILSDDLRLDRRPARKRLRDVATVTKKKPTEKPAVLPNTPPKPRVQSNRQPQTNHSQQPELLHNPPPNPMNYHGYGELVVPMHMPEFHPYMGYPSHGENKALHQPSMGSLEQQQYVVGNHVL